MQALLTVTILAFGISRDIMGTPSLTLSLESPCTVGDLRRQLLARWPAMSTLASLAIAVNSDYAMDDRLLQPDDEVALIPPVSGG